MSFVDGGGEGLAPGISSGGLTLREPKKEHALPAVVRTVCCVCRVVLVEGPPEPVSHGYCQRCADDARAEMRRLRAAGRIA